MIQKKHLGNTKNLMMTRKIFNHEPIDLGYKDLLTESGEQGRKYITPSGI